MIDPPVDLCVLTFDSAETIAECLTSCLQQTYPNCHIRVLDNGSEDCSVDIAVAILQGASNVDVSTTNLGYARGMNALYERTDGDYIVFLNADCILDKDFVAQSVRRFIDHAETDVVAPLVYRLAVDGLGKPVVDGGACHIKRLMRVQVEDDVETARQCMKSNGACPALRRSAVERIKAIYGSGPFDPVFDTYGEDMDLALRLFEQRCITHFDPTVRAWHERSGSSKQRKVVHKRGRLRQNVVAGRHLNAARHTSGLSMAAIALLLVAQDVMLVAIQATKGDWAVIQDVWSAWCRAIPSYVNSRATRLQHAKLSLRAWPSVGDTW